MKLTIKPHQNENLPFNQLILDTPISSIDDDLLGRKPIVKNIVSAIVTKSKDTHPCYTIGIYGKWGEGKTSVLEMVCEQIEKDEKSNFEIIRFNPWLFKDQESLLLDFFSSLQNGVTDKEVVDNIKQYGPLVSLGVSGLLNFALPGVGSLAKGVFDNVVSSIADIDIDITTLKSNLNKSIEKSGKHHLILIDDVDRLDKDELHALFKLIRQNADFVNTTYMIAMDVDMVSKSIGERFENGGERAGKSFLEKIVQVPIHLPKIQRGHLHKFFRHTVLSQINKLYSQNGDVPSKDKDDIIQEIVQHALPLLTTVREVILYNNSLQFILPNLFGEVNMVDLCLLELLKVFHPEAYYLIRDHKHIVTSSEVNVMQHYFNEKPKEKKERVNQFIAKLLLSADQEKYIFIEKIIYRILQPLNLSYNYQKNDSEKRLCSLIYFDKYFLYTTPDNMITDAEYNDFAKELPKISEEDLLIKMEGYYKLFGYYELERIINQLLGNKHIIGVDNDSIGKICIALSRLSVNSERTGFTSDESNIRIEIYICKIIHEDVYDMEDVKPGYSRIENREKQLEIYTKIFSAEKLNLFHLFLAAHLLGYCNTFYADTSEINKVAANMISRFVDQNGVDKIFGLTQLPITILFTIWKSQNEEEYKKVVNNYITNGDIDIAHFIEKMIGGQIKEHFDTFCHLFNLDVVYDRVEQDVEKKGDKYEGGVGYFVRMYEERYNKK